MRIMMKKLLILFSCIIVTTRNALAFVEDNMPTPCDSSKNVVYEINGNCDITGPDDAYDGCSMIQYSVDPENCKGLKPGEWSTDLGNITIKGTSVCNNIASESDTWRKWRYDDFIFSWDSDTTKLTDENNRFCWCKVEQYIIKNGETQILTNPVWVYESYWDLPYGSTSCAKQCTKSCVMTVEYDAVMNKVFKEKLGIN